MPNANTRMLTLQQGEPFSETKKRLEKRTGFKGKSFEKIKFSIVRRQHFSKPTPIQDGKFALLATCPLFKRSNGENNVTDYEHHR